VSLKTSPYASEDRALEVSRPLARHAEVLVGPVPTSGPAGSCQRVTVPQLSPMTAKNLPIKTNNAPIKTNNSNSTLIAVIGQLVVVTSAAIRDTFPWPAWVEIRGTQQGVQNVPASHWNVMLTNPTKGAGRTPDAES